MDSSDSKYQQMAAQVVQAIEQGALQAGQRLPSVREWARQFGVSHNTALQAMRTLEDGHWIEARQRSGFFVRALNEPLVDEPQAIQVSWCLQRLMGQSLPEGGVSFGAVTPDAELLAPDRVRHAMQRTLTEHSALLSEYPTTYSVPELQQALARYALTLGCALHPDDIVVTHSCMDAVLTALQLVTKAGDVVAIESPTHYSFLSALEKLGLRGLEIPTDRDTGMSLDALQLALEHHPVKAVLTVPTLHNPLSCSMPALHRKRLAHMAQTHDVAVIEDAVYNDWTDHEAYRKPVKAYDTSGHVILCHAFTKSLAPGLRLGWMHAGRWSSQAHALRDAQLAPPTPLLQLALANLLGQAGYAAHMRRCRHIAQARLREARGLIGKHFPADVGVNHSVEGMIIWLRLPEHMDADAFSARCLREGLLVPSGRYFSPTGRYGNCFRISVGAWSDAHRKALIHMGAIACDMNKPLPKRA